MPANACSDQANQNSKRPASAKSKPPSPPTTVGTRTRACRRTLTTIKPILERKNPCKRKIRTKNQSHTRTPHHGRYAHPRVPANACSNQANLRTRNAPQAQNQSTHSPPTTVGTRPSACRRTLATIKPILERKNPCKRKIRTKNQSHTRTPHHGRYAHPRVPANACSDQSNLRTRNAPQAPIVFLLCFL